MDTGSVRSAPGGEDGIGVSGIGEVDITESGTIGVVGIPAVIGVVDARSVAISSFGIEDVGMGIVGTGSVAIACVVDVMDTGSVRFAPGGEDGIGVPGIGEVDITESGTIGVVGNPAVIGVVDARSVAVGSIGIEDVGMGVVGSESVVIAPMGMVEDIAIGVVDAIDTGSVRFASGEADGIGVPRSGEVDIIESVTIVVVGIPAVTGVVDARSVAVESTGIDDVGMGDVGTGSVAIAYKGVVEDIAIGVVDAIDTGSVRSASGEADGNGVPGIGEVDIMESVTIGVVGIPAVNGVVDARSGASGSTGMEDVGMGVVDNE